MCDAAPLRTAVGFERRAPSLRQMFSTLTGTLLQQNRVPYNTFQLHGIVAHLRVIADGGEGTNSRLTDVDQHW